MYESIEELPDTVSDVLPQEAQEIYLETYNRSWETYDKDRESAMSREAVANRDGWTAVKREFTKDDESGKWYPAGEAPEREDEAEENLLGGIEFDDVV